MGAGHEYDDDVLYAAAWLHDLGVFVGHRPEDLESLARWDNVAYAMRQTPVVLQELSFPEEKIPSVLEAIRTHQPHSEPVTLEAIILRDADILEQLGAIAILRQVSKVGRDTRFPTFTAAVASLRRNLDELPAKLLLESARRLAESKIKLLGDFLSGVEAEGLNALY